MKSVFLALFGFALLTISQMAGAQESRVLTTAESINLATSFEQDFDSHSNGGTLSMRKGQRDLLISIANGRQMTSKQLILERCNFEVEKKLACLVHGLRFVDSGTGTQAAQSCMKEDWSFSPHTPERIACVERIYQSSK